MPHSSGGSSGSGHSCGYGGGSSRLHRYVYHTPRGAKSLMAAEEPSENGLRKYKKDLTILTMILLTMIVILVSVICLIAKPKHKLSLPNDSESIVIDDVSLLTKDEKNDLLKSCDNFRDKTGIPVEIYIGKQGVIEGNRTYPNLRDFAYDKYIAEFKDESHWLLAYAATNGAKFAPDWRFEGMQGNDTDPVLTTSNADKFNAELETNLGHGLSVSDSFIIALDHASTYMVGTWNFSDDNCVYAMITLLGILISTCIVGIQGYCNISKWKEYLANQTSTHHSSNESPII